MLQNTALKVVVPYTFKTNWCAVLTITKELEAESTLVPQVYPMLGLHLGALLSHWHDPSDVFTSALTGLLDLLDENDHSTTVAHLHGYYAAVADKWRRTVCDALQYSSESFLYSVQIGNPNAVLPLVLQMCHIVPNEIFCTILTKHRFAPKGGKTLPPR